MGTGVRVKKIGPIAAKVYAVGVYADSSKAASELASYSASGADALAKNDVFYKDAKAASFEKTLVSSMRISVSKCCSIPRLQSVFSL